MNIKLNNVSNIANDAFGKYISSSTHPTLNTTEMLRGLIPSMFVFVLLWWQYDDKAIVTVLAS
jgi:hypothetical protein